MTAECHDCGEKIQDGQSGVTIDEFTMEDGVLVENPMCYHDVLCTSCWNDLLQGGRR